MIESGRSYGVEGHELRSLVKYERHVGMKVADFMKPYDRPLSIVRSIQSYGKTLTVRVLPRSTVFFHPAYDRPEYFSVDAFNIYKNKAEY